MAADLEELLQLGAITPDEYALLAGRPPSDRARDGNQQARPAHGNEAQGRRHGTEARVGSSRLQHAGRRLEFVDPDGDTVRCDAEGGCLRFSVSGRPSGPVRTGDSMLLEAAANYDAWTYAYFPRQRMFLWLPARHLQQLIDWARATGVSVATGVRDAGRQGVLVPERPVKRAPGRQLRAAPPSLDGSSKSWANLSFTGMPETPALALSRGLPDGEFEEHPLRVPEFALRKSTIVPRCKAVHSDCPGVYEVDLLATVEGRMPLEGIASELGASSVEGRLSLSSRLTLPRQARLRMDLPRGAATYAWLYPPDLSRVRPEVLQRIPDIAPVKALMLFGGFVYLDDHSRAVAALAVAPGKGIQFDTPKRLPAECLEQVRHRLMPATILQMREAGALWYCWLAPGECFTLRDGSSFSNFPHGAFVACFGADKEHADLDCYVSLTGAVDKPVPDGDFKFAPVFQKGHYVPEEDDVESLKGTIRRSKPRPKFRTPAQYRVFDTHADARDLMEEVFERVVDAGHRIKEEASRRGLDPMDPDSQMKIAVLCREMGTEYIDLSFPPVGSEFAGRNFSNAVALKPSDILAGGAHPVLFSDFQSRNMIDPSDICQGDANDCWILGAAAAAAEFPELIRRTFCSADSSVPRSPGRRLGAHVVRLCRSGWWRDVVVDSYLPCKLVLPAKKEGKQGHRGRKEASCIGSKCSAGIRTSCARRGSQSSRRRWRRAVTRTQRWRTATRWRLWRS
eukprot:TRINITY_DN15932_c0_g1_i2.p1 TRINITY_DN15932_c0_g1~~TRINITY_DN15932_c0_g1_i2.p1  ORF type:complete len:756 (+),score=97.85 TRINITY_DN15932_c0_g1_i2:59-2269(+)